MAAEPPPAVAWARDLEVGLGGPLLPAFDLTVRAGERWAVLGPNGSGKSTFLRTLLGLLRPWRGEAGRRRPAAYVAQRPPPDEAMPGRVRDWVEGGAEVGWSFLVPGDGRRRRARAALERAGLSDLAGAPLTSLSEGQRQRAWLARALACRPAWLVLDEPTSAMDAASERRMLGEVAAWCGESGGAAVWAGHRVEDLLAFASHLWLAVGGAAPAVFAGAREEVLARPAARAALGAWGR